jgi:hypothetical protein
MAQHLIDYPLARIPAAPISPLRDLVRDPPRIGVTLGFSVFQGMTMLLSRQSALASFAPLLALLRALGILAIYVWLRATMGLGRRAALLGTAGASAGALLLWVSYFNFAMQLAAWPLLALGLTLGIAAVEELAHPTPRLRRLGVALLAGVALAALPVAYYPALTIWIPMATPCPPPWSRVRTTAAWRCPRMAPSPVRRRPTGPAPIRLPISPRTARWTPTWLA